MFEIPLRCKILFKILLKQLLILNAILLTVLEERIKDLEHKLKLWTELEELFVDIDSCLSENESLVSASLGTKQDLDKILVSSLFSKN